MRRSMITIVVFLIGLILLIGGVAAYYKTTETVRVCEACSMEIRMDDPSHPLYPPIKIVTADEEEHWGCCSICALAIAQYYKEASLYTKCFWSGDPITIEAQNGEITSHDPETVMVVVGGACPRNKFISTKENGEKAMEETPRLSEATIKNLDEAQMIAGKKAPDWYIGPKPLKTPSVIYVLTGLGIIFIVVSLVMFLKGRSR